MDDLKHLERKLTLSSYDKSLWKHYETRQAQSYGSDLPESSWLTHQYLCCLAREFSDPRPLNELAFYFENVGQTFNAMLCRLASLAAEPAQIDVYEATERVYHAGGLAPAPYAPIEPVTCTVSIILATRDRPASLRQAIASVLNQSFQDFELLVINDGGTEQAESVVESFASPRIRYFSKERGGHRSAMNLGLQVARGKYIAYLDDDDIYFPHHMDTVVEAAEKQGLDFVCSRNRWVMGRWENRRWIETQDLTRQEPFSVKRLHISPVIADLTVLHKRSLAERVGLFWEDPPRGGEWEYWVRCSHYTQIKRLDTVTAEVRVESVVPANQPARVHFFTELWRNYFGSAFGEAILAAAASHNRDQETCCQHIGQIDGSWLYLRKRILDLLWSLDFSKNGQQEMDLRLHIAKTHPAWLMNRLSSRTDVRTGMRCHLDQTPLKAYLHVVCYLFSHPDRLLSGGARIIKKLMEVRSRLLWWRTQ